MSSDPNAPVCWYWQKGSCSFGPACRNRHIGPAGAGGGPPNAPTGPRTNAFGNTSFGNTSANTSTNAANPTNKPSGGPAFNIQTLQADMKEYLKSGMWPLTCYGPQKYEPTLLEGDTSPEEVMLEWHKQRRTSVPYGSGQASYEYMWNESVKRMRDSYSEEPARLSAMLTEAERRYWGARSGGPSSTAAPAPVQSAFGPGGMGQPQTTPSAFGPGGMGQPQPLPSAFGPGGMGQPVQSAFGPGGMGQPQPTPSAFGPGGMGQSQPTPSAFGPGGMGQPQPTPSAFGPGGMGQPQPAQPGTSAFGPGGYGQPTQPQQAPSAFGPGGQGPPQPPQQPGFGASAFGPGGAGPPQPQQPFGQPPQQPFGQPFQPPVQSAFGPGGAGQPQPVQGFAPPGQSAFGPGGAGQPQQTQPTPFGAPAAPTNAPAGASQQQRKSDPKPAMTRRQRPLVPDFVNPFPGKETWAPGPPPRFDAKAGSLLPPEVKAQTRRPTYPETDLARQRVAAAWTAIPPEFRRECEDMWKSDKFEYGKIPGLPPPSEYR